MDYTSAPTGKRQIDKVDREQRRVKASASDLFLTLFETFKEVTKITHRAEVSRRVSDEKRDEQGPSGGESDDGTR